MTSLCLYVSKICVLPDTDQSCVSGCCKVVFKQTGRRHQFSSICSEQTGGPSSCADPQHEDDCGGGSGCEVGCDCISCKQFLCKLWKFSTTFDSSNALVSALKEQDVNFVRALSAESGVLLYGIKHPTEGGQKIEREAGLCAGGDESTPGLSKPFLWIL